MTNTMTTKTRTIDYTNAKTIGDIARGVYKHVTTSRQTGHPMVVRAGRWDRSEAIAEALRAEGFHAFAGVSQGAPGTLESPVVYVRPGRLDRRQLRRDLVRRSA